MLSTTYEQPVKNSPHEAGSRTFLPSVVIICSFHVIYVKQTFPVFIFSRSISVQFSQTFRVLSKTPLSSKWGLVYTCQLTIGILYPYVLVNKLNSSNTIVIWIIEQKWLKLFLLGHYLDFWPFFGYFVNCTVHSAIDFRIAIWFQISFMKWAG